MKNLIHEALENSYTYKEYRDLVSDLVSQKKVTGHEQSDDLLRYTELNEARMHRLDKTIQLDEEVNLFLENLDKKYLWIVISEGWCGDAAQLIPIINKMALVSDKIEMKIVLRDDNEELMNQFLTNASKSIPKLIILDEDLNLINDFGPRPKDAKNLVLDYKEKHGIIDETIKIELQKWYLHDKGISTQNEIMDLMR